MRLPRSARASLLSRAALGPLFAPLILGASLVGCTHAPPPEERPVPGLRTAFEDSPWARKAPERAARVAAHCEALLAMEKSGRVRRFGNPYQLRAHRRARLVHESLSGCHTLAQVNAQLAAAEAEHMAVAMPDDTAAP